MCCYAVLPDSPLESQTDPVTAVAAHVHSGQLLRYISVVQDRCQKRESVASLFEELLIMQLLMAPLYSGGCLLSAWPLPVGHERSEARSAFQTSPHRPAKHMFTQREILPPGFTKVITDLGSFHASSISSQ